MDQGVHKTKRQFESQGTAFWLNTIGADRFSVYMEEYSTNNNIYINIRHGNMTFWSICRYGYLSLGPSDAQPKPERSSGSLPFEYQLFLTVHVPPLLYRQSRHQYTL